MFKIFFFSIMLLASSAHASTELNCEGKVIDTDLYTKTNIKFITPTLASLDAVLISDGKEVYHANSAQPLTVVTLGSVYTISGNIIGTQIPKDGKMEVKEVSFHFDSKNMTSDLGNREDHCTWGN